MRRVCSGVEPTSLRANSVKAFMGLESSSSGMRVPMALSSFLSSPMEGRIFSTYFLGLLVKRER